MKHRDGSECPPLHAEYSNYFQIGHDAFEFLFDFGQLCNRDEAVHIHSRIMMPPDVAQHLVDVLTATLAAYQERFGRISNLAPEPVTPCNGIARGRISH